MIKSKKVLFLFVIFCCVCILAGFGAAPKLSTFYGVYVCQSNNSSRIEFLDFAVPQRTATVNFRNINFPSHNLNDYSQENVKAKVFKKKGSRLYFATTIDGKRITGYLDIAEQKVEMDGLIYVKRSA